MHPMMFLQKNAGQIFCPTFLRYSLAAETLTDQCGKITICKKLKTHDQTTSLFVFVLAKYKSIVTTA